MSIVSAGLSKVLVVNKWFLFALLLCFYAIDDPVVFLDHKFAATRIAKSVRY